MKVVVSPLILFAFVLAGGCSDDAVVPLTCESHETICSNTCVDLNANKSHCGACDSTCKDGEVCQSGSCALFCQTGFVDCGGACIDPKTDRQHCGAAGTCDTTVSTDANFKGATCSSGQVCAGGTCAASCLAQQVLCNDKCIDPQNDLDNCGATLGGTCDNTDDTNANYQGADCAPGQVCAAGTCAATCLAQQVLCGGKCIDPQTDNAFCGAALGGTCDSTDDANADYQGATCASGEYCNAGACATTCLDTQVLCGDKCIDPQTDVDFCGAALGGTCDSTDDANADYAGADCASGETCQSGTCSSSCLGTQVLCGSHCINPTSDLSYCGAALGGTCDSAEPTDANYQGTACVPGEICSAGACKTSCLSTQVLCGTRCADPLTDNSYCGAKLAGACDSSTPSSDDYWGQTCPAGETCVAGICAATCGGGLLVCGDVCVDPQHNPNHCGSCANACNTIGRIAPVCISGACSYSSPLGNVEMYFYQLLYGSRVQDTYLTSNPFADNHDGGFAWSPSQESLFAIYGNDNFGRNVYKITYDFTGDSWSSASYATLVYNRHGSYPVIDEAGGWIYFPPSQYTNELERVSLTDGTTRETMTAAPANATFSKGAWQDGKLWIVLNNGWLYEYDPAVGVGGTWTQKQTIGSTSLIAANPVNDLIYIARGNSTSFRSYDVKTDTLTTLANVSVAVSLGGNGQITFIPSQADTSAGYIYVVAGCGGTPRVYSIADDTWHAQANPWNNGGCDGHSEWIPELETLFVTGNDQVWTFDLNP